MNEDDVPTWVNALPDRDREAYALGFDRGWKHAAFVDAYGTTPDPETPDRFTGNAAMRWEQGYGDGKDRFAQVQDESEDFA